MKKAFFIVNPQSGEQNYWQEIEGVIGCLVLNEIVNHTDICLTQKSNDAGAAAEKLKAGAYDVVVAVGGDGTVNDVAGGLIRGGSRIPLAVLPMGTNNVFASHFGMPSDKGDFCRMLRGFRLTDVDAGRINDRYFVSSVTGGMGSEIGYKAGSFSKSILGKRAFTLEAIKNVPKGLFRYNPITIESDEFSGSVNALSYYISNVGGPAITKKFMLKNAVNDGVFDVVVFGDLAPDEYAAVMFQTLINHPVKHPKVHTFTTSSIRISPDGYQPMPVNCDGDMFGTLPIEMECLKKAIRLVVP